MGTKSFLDIKSFIPYEFFKIKAQPIHLRMDVRKRGENPPLPRSREGNESRTSHCPDVVGMGRPVSRPPEAGRPVHPINL